MHTLLAQTSLTARSLVRCTTSPTSLVQAATRIVQDSQQVPRYSELHVRHCYRDTSVLEAERETPVYVEDGPTFAPPSEIPLPLGLGAVIPVPDPVSVIAASEPAAIPQVTTTSDTSDGGKMKAQSDWWLRTRMMAGTFLQGALTLTMYIVPAAAALYLARHQFAEFWSWYCAVLAQKPLITKMATGAVGTFIGDLLAQYTTFVAAKRAAVADAASSPRTSSSGDSSGANVSSLPKFQYDIARAIRIILYVTFVGTPVSHYWFEMLDGNISPENPTLPWVVVTKMVLDQFVACPMLTTAFFFIMSTLEGQPSKGYDSAKRLLLPTLRANWCLWPAAHIINFAFVPSSQRVLYCTVVSIFWTAILSTIVNAAPKKEKVA